MTQEQCSIPDSLQETWTDLEKEVVWLHLHWNVYRELFAKSAERIALLDESGAVPFRVFHNVLVRDVILSLCRLTDPLESCGHENASLAQLVEAVRGGSWPDLLPQMESAFEELKAQCEPLRPLRNRVIAHRDLETVRNPDDNPLPGISRANIEACLNALRRIMDTFHLFFTKGSVSYQCTEPQVEHLVNSLKQAVKYRELERNGEIVRGRWTEGKHKDA